MADGKTAFQEFEELMGREIAEANEAFLRARMEDAAELDRIGFYEPIAEAKQ